MSLTRFGVSIDSSLLKKFDRKIKEKGYTNRSEAFRDMIRDSFIQEKIESGSASMVGTVTLIFSHHEMVGGQLQGDSSFISKQADQRFRQRSFREISCPGDVQIEARSIFEQHHGVRRVVDITDAVIARWTGPHRLENVVFHAAAEFIADFPQHLFDSGKLE